jgi:hypothetical protein
VTYMIKREFVGIILIAFPCVLSSTVLAQHRIDVTAGNERLRGPSMAIYHREFQWQTRWAIAAHARHSTHNAVPSE